MGEIVTTDAFKAFTIHVAPNPTATKFGIAVEGSENKMAELKVYYNKGNLVEIKRGMRINSVVEPGEYYSSGI